jgi:hypothetical protein
MKTILSMALVAMSIGPVLLNGTDTLTPPHLSDGQSFTVTASQPDAPPGTYYIAGTTPECVAHVSVIAGGQPGAPPFSGYITSMSKFTIYRLGDPAGCQITISSSAGGRPTTIAF